MFSREIKKGSTGLLALGLPGLLQTARAQELVPGAVIEKVTCGGDARQSYALYPPSAYSRDRAWPIVYAFDPGARGAVAAERFRDAAERFGVIVVGSNNSRNGPLQQSQDALNAMLADTRARFSLDARRVYMTGFSGGARVAATAGLSMQGRVAGVMGFGAGFPAGMPPPASVPFAYFSAAGTGDFNYGELVELDRALQGLGVPHRFETFDGGHEWPPESVCSRALEWMVLQGMRSGRWARDAALVQRIYATALEEAAADARAGRVFQAFQRYEAMAQDYEGMCDVTAGTQKAQQLRQSREVAQVQADLEAAAVEQPRVTARIFHLVNKVVEGAESARAVQELLGTLANLRRQAEATGRPRERMIAQRALTVVWVGLNEQTAGDFERGEFGHAADRLRIMVQVRPDSATAEYLLARASARTGRTKEALQALERAIGKGFSDGAALRSEPDLEPLRRDPAFQRLLETVRQPGQGPG